MKQTHEKGRIETSQEVQTYLVRLKYAVKGDNLRLYFEKDRRIDENRDKRHTNRYTITKLFPDEDEAEALKQELEKLCVEEYIETLKDTRYPQRSEMRVFMAEDTKMKTSTLRFGLS